MLLGDGLSSQFNMIGKLIGGEMIKWLLGE